MSSWIVVGDDSSTSMAVYVGALYLLSFWRGCIFGLRLLEQSFEDDFVNNVNTTARAELYESGIDPSSFISKGGANILG